MGEARPLLLEQRSNGNTVIVGLWPEQMRLDPALLSELSGKRSLRLGEEFTIELANGSAIYRCVDLDGEGNLICAKIKRLS
jgi:hypothetical protein